MPFDLRLAFLNAESIAEYTECANVWTVIETYTIKRRNNISNINLSNRLLLVTNVSFQNMKILKKNRKTLKRYKISVVNRCKTSVITSNKNHENNVYEHDLCLDGNLATPSYHNN